MPPRSVSDILDALRDRAVEDDRVTVGDLVDTLGSRTYGPFLVLPALIGLSPISGIPTVPTLLAGLIAIFAGQILLGRDQMWLPGFIRRRHLPEDKLIRSIEALEPAARTLDRWFHGRLAFLSSGVFVKIASAACIALAITTPPLELAPFAAALPMTAIALFGVALTVRDGVLMAAALAVTAGAVGLGAWLLL